MIMLQKYTNLLVKLPEENFSKSSAAISSTPTSNEDQETIPAPHQRYHLRFAPSVPFFSGDSSCDVATAEPWHELSY